MLSALAAALITRRIDMKEDADDAAEEEWSD